MKYLLIIISFFLLNSCIPAEYKKNKNLYNSLKKASKNKNELIKVLEFYKEDSLKKETAKFLISNMINHYWSKNYEDYNWAFDSIVDYIDNFKIKNGVKYFKDGKNYSDKKNITKKFDYYVSSIISEHSFFDNKKNYDLKHIDSNFIIENIDLALASWEEIPLKYRLDFDQFCKYVLPYRNNNEPLKKGFRKELKQEFKWVIGKMNTGNYTPLEIITEVIDSLKIKKNIDRVTKGLPFTMPPHQVKRVGFGTCTDLTTYAIHVLRSIGIGATQDFTPKWGDQNGGHSWLAAHFNDEVILKDVEQNTIINDKIKGACFSKIYRKSFQSNDFDKIESIRNNLFYEKISNTYFPSFDVKIRNINNYRGKLKLCVFNHKKWVVVDVVNTDSIDSIKLEGLNKKCIYILMEGNKQKKPISDPFLIDENGDVRYFNSMNNRIIKNTIITRKYPKYHKRDGRMKEFYEAINGSIILASNDMYFNKRDTLLQIKRMSDNKLHIHRLNHSKKYRYYKLDTKDKNLNRFAEFHLIGVNGEILNNWFNMKLYAKIEGLGSNKGISLFTDNNSLTSAGGKEMYLVVDLKKPTKINEIRYQPVNKGNNIKIGDHYELFYWDNKWVSLGEKTANNHELTYENVPLNSLFWLKNHSGGREEHLFTIDKEGRQIWPSLDL